jgi:stearoyl-CoA desaturase (delta-9 desaturase)
MKGFWVRVYWENILFLVLTHVLGAAAVAYTIFIRSSPATWALAGVWLVLCPLAISGGYHRLYSHRSYRCSAAVEIFHLCFGAAAWQASALYWASDHRDHHAYTDQEGDPYNITKGFWWAHWGWLCWRGEPKEFKNSKDLLENKLVAFQDRHYVVLALLFGMLIPTLIAWTWGDAAGGLLLAGFLRILVQYHASFAVNSFAHTFGTRPYSTANSARESVLPAAINLIMLPTMGEGLYHNYHHRFPSDYRNGIRFYHYDPVKWMVWTLSKVKLAWDLKTTPAEVIQRARESVNDSVAGALPQPLESEP